MQAITQQAIDPAQLDALVRRAADVLNGGGLVVFPTETVYGIAASVGSEAGLAALRRFKGHGDTGAEPPLTVHLPSPDAAERYIDASAPMLRRLLRKVFPGPVTLIVEESEEVIGSRLKAMGLPQEARGKVYQRNTVSLRCPDHPLASHVLGSVGAPVVAASANRPGDGPPHDADAARRSVGDAAGLVIDGGRCRFAKPSTVVRITGSGAKRNAVVEREGVYDARYIQKLLRWTMLLVCSGNTCRSPMAEGIARKLLAEERGIDVSELESRHIRVISAGASAAAGMPAADDAVEAMNRLGIDLTRHRSRPLTVEMIHEADAIFTMTADHRQAVLDMLSSAADKTFMLDPNGDIEDPIGGGKQVYQRTAEIIRRRLAQRLKEQQP